MTKEELSAYVAAVMKELKEIRLQKSEICDQVKEFVDENYQDIHAIGVDESKSYQNTNELVELADELNNDSWVPSSWERC